MFTMLLSCYELLVLVFSLVMCLCSTCIYWKELWALSLCSCDHVLRLHTSIHDERSRCCVHIHGFNSHITKTNLCLHAANLIRACIHLCSKLCIGVMLMVRFVLDPNAAPYTCIDVNNWQTHVCCHSVRTMLVHGECLQLTLVLILTSIVMYALITCTKC
jgi:hypothetical protein